ncbi:MAG: LacI family DNA-binding transcriptional regulator [Verrucomicrobiota bacterium]
MSEVNQQTIADRLGLSRATVSRCFTNHAGISPVTRAKVFQTAAEIGYTHMETRSPKAKRSKKEVNFNVLICSDPDEYFRGGYESPGEQILAGVSEYAQSHGARVDVNLIPPDVTDTNHQAFRDVEGLVKRNGNGVLLIYPFPKKVIDELALRFPLVSLVDQLEHTSIDCVDVDHYSGISAVVDHLIEKGHERIGFYTRDYTVEASWSYRRYSAFIERMARLKLRVSPKDIVGMFPSRWRGLEQSLDEVAERTEQGVTAWICAADHQGYDLIQGLKKRGFRVPKDVSVTGFDGIEPEGKNPALTTIQIPFREIGMTGAERLAARLRKRFHGKQHVYISGKLKAGKTVGKPAG